MTTMLKKNIGYSDSKSPLLIFYFISQKKSYTNILPKLRTNEYGGFMMVDAPRLHILILCFPEKHLCYSNVFSTGPMCLMILFKDNQPS